MNALSTIPNAAIPLAERKADDMTPQDWEGLKTGLTKFLDEEAQEPEHAEDESSGIVYVARPLLDGESLATWALNVGFEDVVEPKDMRVIVAVTRAMPAELASGDVIAPDANDASLNGTRVVERIGEQGPIAIRFSLPELMQRRRELDENAKYRPEDAPRIIVARHAPDDLDIDAIEPFSGPMHFGPEMVTQEPEPETKTGAILFVTRKGKVLFLRRAMNVPEPDEWDLPGGHLEAGEDAADAARREAEEETGLAAPLPTREVDRVVFDGVEHVTFAMPLGKKFKPTLSDEHVDWEWAPMDNPPRPLRPPVAAALAAFRALPPQEQGARKHFGAGIMFVEPGGRVLFLKRHDKSDHPGEWALPGGRPDDGERPDETALREALEETEYAPKVPLKLIDEGDADDDEYYAMFAARTPRFRPRINDEHVDHVWAHPTTPPRPLHPGLAAALARVAGEGDLMNLWKTLPGKAKGADQYGAKAEEQIESGIPPKGELEGKNVATDSALRLALDRDSLRKFDKDGRMRVAVTNISKANICPYRGDEIPGWDPEKEVHALGLDPNKIYMLLRDPEELKKSIPTWNGIQLLRKHIPVDVDDHRKFDIVGTTGTDASFDGTYLTNSLIVWSKEGIDLIESGDQRELSCGYHYKPLMIPGIFDGQPYDGVMTEIEGNHVALVEEGRAGPDVMVADSMEELQWNLISRALEQALSE